MLDAYLTQTENLLQSPGSPQALYSTTNLTLWINTARSQLAGEGECIRYYGTLPLVGSTQSYGLASINTGTSSANGIQGVLNVRQIYLSGGTIMLRQWPWEYFNFFYVANTTIAEATPVSWAQYGQGVTGSIYLSPTPSATITANLDCVCYPIPLVDDTTVEAIPYPWTDAVPFFAAYFALLSAQAGERQDDADRMFARYQEFANRARRFSTPAVTPYQSEQSGISSPVPPAGVMPPSNGGG